MRDEGTFTRIRFLNERGICFLRKHDVNLNLLCWKIERKELATDPIHGFSRIMTAMLARFPLPAKIYQFRETE